MNPLGGEITSIITKTNPSSNFIMVKDYYISQTLSRVRSGDEHVVSELYVKHRKKFVAVLWRKFGKTFDISDIIDEYQECITILYERIVTKPDFTITGSIDQYLIRAGEYRLRARYQREKTQISLDAEEGHGAPHWREDVAPQPQGSSSLLQKVYGILDEEFPLYCAEILDMFYLERKSYEEISAEMRTRFPEMAMNPDAIKALKYRVIKKLRKIISEQKVGYRDG